MHENHLKRIQLLIAEIVQDAGNGHPGAAISLTPLFHVLSSNLRFDPEDPLWLDRDILIMSNGHACLVQYVFMHFRGLLTMQDLKDYRKLHSKTPGHPETSTPGIEVVTGPLGQGISNAVGFSISQAKLKNKFKKFINENQNLSDAKNKPKNLLKQATICIFGDGCYQEGISHESFSLACHLNSNIIFIYDCNGTTIDGKTELSMSDDIFGRFIAYGFLVKEVDGDDIELLDKIISEKLLKIREGNDEGVLMIILKTKIAKGFLLEGNEKSHGAALGKDVVEEFRKKNKIEGECITKEIYEIYNKINEKNREERKKWNEEIKNFYLLFENEINKENYLPDLRKSQKLYYKINCNDFFKDYKKEENKIATRKHFSNALEDIKPLLPFLIAGSGDLTPSCLTKCKTSTVYNKTNLDGDYIHYGIREHGMFGIMNGISSHGFYLPIGSTFLNFITYGFPAVRLACISQLKNIYVMTHDSIGLGEDGPTHQPIETLALLRATPGLFTLRPCDGVETRFALKFALESDKSTVICLSRQNLENIKGSCFKKCERGAYKIFEINEKKEINDDVKNKDIKNQNENNVKKQRTPEKSLLIPNKKITIFATGSEVCLAIQVAKIINADVVSLISFEIFDRQDEEYKKSILGGFKVSIEALSTFGWSKYVNFSIGMNSFGLSGKTEDVYDYFGFSIENLCEKILKEYEKTIVY